MTNSRNEPTIFNSQRRRSTAAPNRPHSVAWRQDSGINPRNANIGQQADKEVVLSAASSRYLATLNARALSAIRRFMMVSRTALNYSAALPSFARAGSATCPAAMTAPVTGARRATATPGTPGCAPLAA